MADISYATYDVVEMSRAEDNYDYQETADSMYNQLQRSEEMKRCAVQEPTSEYSVIAKENVSYNVNGEKQMRASVPVARDEPNLMSCKGGNSMKRWKVACIVAIIVAAAVASAVIVILCLAIEIHLTLKRNALLNLMNLNG